MASTAINRKLLQNIICNNKDKDHFKGERYIYIYNSCRILDIDNNYILYTKSSTFKYIGTI